MKKNPSKAQGEQLAFPGEFFTRELHINGRINCPLYEKLKLAIRMLNKEKGYIVVFIDSNGGDFFAARKIHQLFRKSRNPIIGIAGKNVASVAAMLVFQGCKARLVTKDTKMLLHNVKQTVAFEYVPYRTHKRLSHSLLAEEFKKAEGYQDFIYDVLMKSSGRTKSEISTILIQEKTLSAPDILKFGFADAII